MIPDYVVKDDGDNEILEKKYTKENFINNKLKYEGSSNNEEEINYDE